MFGFNKKKRPEKPSSDTATSTQTEVDSNNSNQEPDLASRLAKTRRGFSDKMADFLLGKKAPDQIMLDELETCLLSADVGIETSTKIIDSLNQRLSRKALSDNESLRLAISQIMQEILLPCEQSLVIDGAARPYVILVVGTNGAGKTTSIGKLAYHFKQQGKSVLLAAGDTFRAAAVEQLQEWGKRNNIPVTAQGTGADPASVIFDAIESAKSKNIDIVIADTAGRLHTQNNLMDELKKIKRVMGKIDPNAPHETMLVIDAGFGQNALTQAQQFHEMLGLTGLAVTKLDGTAKGGILFAIANQLNLPIRFIGVGEGINDLQPFNANAFVQALLE